MSAFRFTLLLITASLTPLFAQDSAPRIAFSHTRQALVIKLLDAGPINSWCVEASTDLIHWVGLGEMLEINGAGEFRDPLAPLCKSRYYRAIHKGQDLQAALDRNRARWQDSHIKNYDFTFQWICFCTPDFVTPVNISVRNGEISSISRDGRGVPPSQFVNYLTMDGLFDFLQDVFDETPHSITARFDPRNGAPVKARVDYLEFADDDEREFVVENLRIAAAAPVQISDTPPVEIQLDPFSLQGASIRGNTLTIDLEHGGGCAEHDYELFMSPAVFLESFPVQANLYIRHDGDDDPCDSLVRAGVSFDLRPISELYGRPGPIVLNIYEYFADIPGDPIRVTYE